MTTRCNSQRVSCFAFGYLANIAMSPIFSSLLICDVLCVCMMAGDGPMVFESGAHVFAHYTCPRARIFAWKNIIIRQAAVERGGGVRRIGPLPTKNGANLMILPYVWQQRRRRHRNFRSQPHTLLCKCRIRVADEVIECLHFR